MNESSGLGTICIAAVSAFVGWIIGRRASYKRISEMYKQSLDNLKEQITKLEAEFKKAHNLQNERANLEYERETFRRQSEQIRKDIVNQAKADAIDELKKTHNRFPYM